MIRSCWPKFRLCHPGTAALSTSAPTQRPIRVACASGFWGDTATAPAQLIHKGQPDYLIFDYLSELTMSLLTAAKQKKPELGYAPDFVLYGVGPYLKDIKEKGQISITISQEI